MTTRTVTGATSLVLLIAMSGCGGEETPGPPDIRLGRDECVQCGMSIVEDRCSCGILVLDRGHLEHRLFDDIGDMLDYERTTADLVVKERYVHDYDTRAWVIASKATYVYAEAVHTPMASGLVAFSSVETARPLAEKHSGRVLNWEEVGKLRVAWRVERYGK